MNHRNLHTALLLHFHKCGDDADKSIGSYSEILKNKSCTEIDMLLKNFPAKSVNFVLSLDASQLHCPVEK
jgi:hypothetical protein